MPDADTECVFCRIARRELHSHAVYEDDLVFSFLDARPIRPGVPSAKKLSGCLREPAGVLSEFLSYFRYVYLSGCRYVRAHCFSRPALWAVLHHHGGRDVAAARGVCDHRPCVRG